MRVPCLLCEVNVLHDIQAYCNFDNTKWYILRYPVFYVIADKEAL